MTPEEGRLRLWNRMDNPQRKMIALTSDLIALTEINKSFPE